MSYYLKSPIKERLKYRKSVDSIQLNLKYTLNKNTHTDSKIKFFPCKKKSTKNIKRYIANLKFNKNILKKIYNKYRFEGGIDFS